MLGRSADNQNPRPDGNPERLALAGAAIYAAALVDIALYIAALRAEALDVPRDKGDDGWPLEWWEIQLAADLRMEQ